MVMHLVENLVNQRFLILEHSLVLFEGTLRLLPLGVSSSTSALWLLIGGWTSKRVSFYPLLLRQRNSTPLTDDRSIFLRRFTVICVRGGFSYLGR